MEKLPPALVPVRLSLVGIDVTLEPLDAAIHGAEMYEASHGSEEGLRIWDCLTYGPCSDVDAYKQFLRAQSASFDPTFFAIRSNKTNKVCGQASFLDTNTVNGMTEIAHIWFGPELQRTRGATEALYLMLRHALGDLGTDACNGAVTP